jgi:hypothetical protein
LLWKPDVIAFSIVSDLFECALWCFFYCQALITGFGCKRWTVAGIFFGPLIWPIFAMKKRMQLNRLFGFEQLIFRA